jgi:TonB family protein
LLGWPTSSLGQSVESTNLGRPPIRPCSADASEGYVLVEFDITAEGNTQNVRVIEYCPSEIFNKAAIKAVQTWEYPPSGEIQPGVQMIVPFRLGAPPKEDQPEKDEPARRTTNP